MTNRFKGSFSSFYTFPNQALFFTCLSYKSFENTVGKGEIARNERFLFSTLWENFLPVLFNLKLSSTNSFSLEEHLKSVERSIDHNNNNNNKKRQNKHNP